MQRSVTDGTILSTCMRELVGLTQRMRWYSCPYGWCLWFYAFNDDEEKLHPFSTPGELVQVTHEWRQIFHTWLAEGTACVAGERREEGTEEGGGGGERKTVQEGLDLSLNHSLHWLDLNTIHWRGLVWVFHLFGVFLYLTKGTVKLLLLLRVFWSS